MGQKLVISVNKYDYAKFNSLQSLQNIDWDIVDVLIFHSCKDTDVNTILELSKAGGTVKKMIYVNEKLNSLFYGIFAGVNADIYNNSAILEDEETLEYIVDNYKESGMTIQSPDSDLEAISKFIATLTTQSASNLSKLVNNPIMLNTLETATKNIETALVRTDESNTGMVEMFNKTSEIIETFQEGQEKTTEELEKLSRYLDEVQNKPKGHEITKFPCFLVPNTVSKVLYVHVFSPCRFLFSFLEAYQHCLKMTKQINTKMLLVAPNLKQFVIKYENFPRLTEETVSKSLQNQPYFVTYSPKSKVWQTFFNMPADIYIVIDMTFGEEIIKGSKVISLSAVNSISDISKFKIDPLRCLIPQIGTNANIVIPYMNGYGSVEGADGKRRATTEMTKRTKYYDTCKDKGYLKIDKLLGI